MVAEVLFSVARAEPLFFQPIFFFRMADRDRHIRDSGLPLNDDSIVTIRGGDSSSDTDSDAHPNIFFNTPAPSPPPRPQSPPIMARAADNQDHVRPQQIANIPLFDGE